MTLEHFDVAIIGAGAAGMSAAIEAAQLGAQVVLIDDNQQLGGQYFRQPSAGFNKSVIVEKSPDHIRFAALCRGINGSSTSYRAGATVWDLIDPLTLAIADGEGSGRIRAKAIVIAAGARDRAVAFPGWTIPGVITAGGLQNLIKGMRVAPPGPAVVAGNGPLLLVAAANLIKAGVHVAAVVEAANQPWRALSELPALVSAPSIMKLAIAYRFALLKSGTPYLQGQTVVAAQGDPDLHSVEIAPIDSSGNIEKNKTQRIEATTLVTGFGLNPSLELPRLIGAQEIHCLLRGGANIARNEELMSSIPGIFVAGDGASIGGVELALVEGRIAGINACVHAGKTSRNSVQNALSLEHKRYRRLCRFRTGLEKVFETNAVWTDLLTPSSIVCRCEDVTYEELARCMKNNCSSATQLKATTRIGMGRCQGRNCLGSLAEIIADNQNLQSTAVDMPRVRQPARPILLSDLLHEELPPPDIPDDPHLPRKR